MIVFREFSFDAAHFLPHVPEGHKCRNVHGHTYKLKVFLQGTLDDSMGWVMDFAEMKQIINPVIDIVDHKLLNDIPGLQNPTCELLIVWFWKQLKPALPLLQKLELNETPTSGAIYEVR